MVDRLHYCCAEADVLLFDECVVFPSVLLFKAPLRRDVFLRRLSDLLCESYVSLASHIHFVHVLRQRVFIVSPNHNC